MLGRLEKSLAAEQRFTADASHELRSPLSAIQMRLQVLKRKYQDDAQLPQALQLIQNDVNRGTQVLENLLEQYKHFSSHLQFSRREVLVRAVAVQQAIKGGTSLSEKEMQTLVSDLFACTQNNTTPSGRPTYVEFGKESLDKMFGR